MVEGIDVIENAVNPLGVTNKYFLLHIFRLLQLLLLFAIALCPDTGNCQNEFTAKRLHSIYGFGDWFAFGEISSQGQQLKDILKSCDPTQFATSPVGIIDSVDCSCLKSKYFLVVLAGRDYVRSSPILRWTLRDQGAGDRKTFSNSARLEEYILKDFQSGSVTDSASARNCSIALATLMSPFLPLYFPERQEQLLPIFGAIWGLSLWEEVLINNNLVEIIGSAAISGEMLDSIARFEKELPFQSSENELIDSLAGATYLVDKVADSYRSEFVTWSPRRSTFSKWTIVISNESIEEVHWEEIKLPKAGVSCGLW